MASADPRAAAMTLRALDVLAAAASGVTHETSVLVAHDVARVVLEGLPFEEQYRVASTVGAMAVWQLPPSYAAIRTAADVRARLGQVNRWIDRVRLEVTWASS